MAIFQEELKAQKEGFSEAFDSFKPEDYAYLGVDMVKLAEVLKTIEPNGRVFGKEMGFLIMITQVRGVSISKISGKSGEELAKRFRTIVGKYGIVPHKKETPITTPTLPRMMSLLPRQIYEFRLAHSANLPTIGTLGSLPKELAWPGGSAMIKNGSTLVPAFVAWYKSFCTVVKIPAPSDEVCLIAHRNSPIIDSDRV